MFDLSQRELGSGNVWFSPMPHDASHGNLPLPPARAGRLSAALRRVLGSPALHASERQKRLLVYLVEEVLAGRAERLKAYNIGTAVLGRDIAFDPQIDPIVRIEVSHLRRCLERYYLTDGAKDEFRIVIPTGCYVPRLERVPLAAHAPPSAPPGARRPPSPSRLRRIIPICAAGLLLLAVIAVVTMRFPVLRDSRVDSADSALALKVRVGQFANASRDAELDPFARTLTTDLMSALVPFKSLDIYVPEAQTRFPRARIDYSLQGAVLRLGDEIAITAQLSDADTGVILWSRYYTVPSNPSHAETRDIAQQIAQVLGDPYGTLHAFEGKASHDDDSLKTRKCLLSFYAYIENWSRSLHRQLRDCHEAVVRRSPGYSEAWAQLAQLYLDEYKYAYNPADRAKPALDRSVDAARLAIATDPTNARAHLALALAWWFKHDLASFSDEANRALSLNPNDPLVTAEIGTRRFLGGDYEGGLALVRKALAQGSGRPLRYHDIIAVDAYLKHDYERALDEALNSDLKDRPFARIILVAIYGKLGRHEEALGLWSALRKEMPQTAAAPRETLLDREWSADIVEALMSGIEAAGVLQRSEDMDGFQVPVPLTFSRTH